MFTRDLREGVWERWREDSSSPLISGEKYQAAGLSTSSGLLEIKIKESSVLVSVRRIGKQLENKCLMGQKEGERGKRERERGRDEGAEREREEERRKETERGRGREYEKAAGT
jgi:hypothetical protein